MKISSPNYNLKIMAFNFVVFQEEHYNNYSAWNNSLHDVREKKISWVGRFMYYAASVANSYLVFQIIYHLQVIEAHQLRGFNVSIKIQSRFQESIVDILHSIEELDNIHYCLTSIIMVPKLMDKICHSTWRHTC